MIYCSYEHIITGAKSDKPEDFLGGILADDMGLGKTLIMLSVIVGSLRCGLDFAYTNLKDLRELQPTTWPSKATLILVPTECMRRSLMVF